MPFILVPTSSRRWSLDELGMDIRPIRTDDDPRRAGGNRAPLEISGRDLEADRLELLTLLVERYEEASWIAKDLDPVDMLDYAFTDTGRSGWNRHFKVFARAPLRSWRASGP